MTGNSFMAIWGLICGSVVTTVFVAHESSLYATAAVAMHSVFAVIFACMAEHGARR